MSSNHQNGLDSLIEENLPYQYDRARHLVCTTAQMMKHFFDKGVYGDSKHPKEDSLPRYWPFVRYLVYDGIKPNLNQGDSQFVNVRWNDRFVQDLVDEAKELIDLLPSNLTSQEWLFIVNVAGYMFMKDPRLVENNYISEEGRKGLIMQNLIFGTDSGDGYEKLFSDWKEQYT
ncbi:hypothetical protein ACFL0X_02425 [Nanoarchaeota archaeon]